ncbi:MULTISPECIES: Ig-like domain-containing protein [unclassified Shewanella]|uniref:Ig-like domain-containing protein n=1 Tax=unclassified Shewanella TaxID=196818 RepID=UPI001E47485D|nr:MULTISPECIES: Ig-like domain-containing protein [unclassified Shewanella]
MTFSKVVNTHFLLLLTFLLIACNGDNDGFPSSECGGPDTPCPAFAVALDITPQVNTLAVDTSDGYTAMATFSDGERKEVTEQVIWSSSEVVIADIAASGVARALTAGKTEIIATLELQAGGEVLSDSAELMVTDAAVIALTIEPAEAEVLVGMSKRYRAIALFADSHKQDVTDFSDWSVDDATIGSIVNQGERKGLATGLVPGVTSISAGYLTVSAEAQLAVLAAAADKLVINPENIIMPQGTSVQYQAYLILENGASIDVTEQSVWQSSMSITAAIDNEAVLTAQELGTTQVSASLKFADISLSDSTLATVVAPEITALTVSPAKVKYPVGTEGDYAAMAYYSDGSVVDVTRDAFWSVEDKQVVSLVAEGESGGHATALAPGVTEVYAEFQQVTAHGVAEVTSAVIESIEIFPIDFVTPVGIDVEYTARARFSDASVHDISLLGYWQSKESNVATIGMSGAKAGRAKALSPGVTDISIDYMGMNTRTSLTVTEAVVSGLQITPRDLQAPVGTQGQYQAIAYFTDGRSSDVTKQATWSSGNTGIISVITSGNKGGYATAYSVGKTGISASYAGLNVKTADNFRALNPSNPEAFASVTTSATVTDAVLMSLIISPTTAKIAAGNSQQYNLTGIFSDGSSKVLTTAASWQVDKTSVAQIDSHGLSLGLIAGDTKITASYLGIKATAELTVTDALIASLQVSPVKSSLALGYHQQQIATAFYSDGHSSDVTRLATWASDDSAVGEVVSSGIQAGYVSAKAVGDTLVRASFDGMTAYAELIVTDAILESVTLSPMIRTIAAGNTQQYQFIGIFSDGSNIDLTYVATWQSGTQDVATVNRKGLARSYIKGMSQISASYSGFSSVAELSVTNASITGLQVTPANSTVPKGTSGQYKAEAFYTDGHTSDVTQLATWSALDPGIINIVAVGISAGLAEATAVGGTKIQANYDGATAWTEITVTDVILETLVVSPARTTIAAGLTQVFQASGIFSDGSSKDLSLESAWQSSDISVASVERDGEARGYRAGETVVTASYIGFSDSSTLTVTDAALSYIQVTPVKVKVAAGTEGQFEARAFYTDGHSEDITLVASWTSLDQAIVYIGTGSLDGGFANALNVGNTQVKAQYLGMSSTAVVEVTAAELLELTVTPPDTSVSAGLDQPYQAFARFSDGSSKEVSLESSWQSSKTDIATIDTAGIAHTLYSGVTEIQASYKTLMAATSLFVNEPILTELQLTPVTSTVNINETQQYILTAFFSDGYSIDVSTAATWSITDDSIAHVVTSGSKAGRVTGNAQGQTGINAQYYGMDAQAEVIVSDLEYLMLSVEPADSKVIVGKTTQLQAFAVYQNSAGMITQKDVTDQSDWRPGDRNKISIDPTGLVHGIEAGFSYTFAMFQGVEGQGAMTVFDREVISLDVTPENLEVPVGTKGRYKATATMFNLAKVDVTDKATWSSSQPDVIHMVTTGTDGGTGTARAVGRSEITAQYEGASDRVTTTVTEPAFEWLEITPGDDVIFAQWPFQYTAMAHFSDGSSVDVTLDANWKSDTPKNIIIQTGNSQAGEALGSDYNVSATISVTYQGKVDSRLVSVEENIVKSVEVNPADISMALGSSHDVEVWVIYANGEADDYTAYVKWSSDNPAVATAHKNQISAHSAGSATVTATFDGVSGSADVTVK